MDCKYLTKCKYINTKNPNTEIYISPSIFKNVDDLAIRQLESINKIPNTIRIIGFPDLQPGFGVPIGSCFTSLAKRGYISCEAVGYDINCGIRLIKTNLTKKDLSKDQLKQLAMALNTLPLGLSKAGIKINEDSLEDILQNGINWAIKRKYAKHKDKYKIDHKGVYKDGKTMCVSKLARQRGIKQVGTLGQGNHFIDLVLVSDIYNKSCAKKYNLKKDQYCILLHTGSRGLGHQVARDYNNIFKNKYPISHNLFYTSIGQSYFVAMKCACNYAFVNRAVLTTLIEEVFMETLNISKTKLGFDLIYDLSHNFASLEKHDGQQVVVHRKGCAKITNKKDLSKSSPYKSVGNPIILPGSMLHPTYILKPKSNLEKYLNTVPHGSGRVLSREEAKNKIKINSLKAKMSKKNILLVARSENILREEQPRAYKDSKKIVECLEKLNIGTKVAKLDPKIVVFG
jgi:tRNA-splicing ligase RtcB